MPYGYLGQTTPNQLAKNSGVLSISDVHNLEKQGKLGGSLELIERQTYVASVNAIDFTNIKEDVYDVHYLTYTNLKIDSNNLSFGIQLYENGVLETASVYHYAYQKVASNGTQYLGSNTSIFMLLDFAATGSSIGKPENGEVFLFNLANASQYSYMTQHGAGIDSFAGAGTIPKSNWVGSVLPQTSKVDGIRITASTPTAFRDFEITLYGVKQK